jgi:hypothetical protein
LRKKNECTSNVTQPSTNSYVEESRCAKGPNAGSVTKVVYTYQGDTASHTEMHMNVGKSETVVIIDAKYLVWPLLSSVGTVFFRGITNMVCALGLSVTPNGEREAWGMAATMDHSSIRGLGTALHLFLAGLPRSEIGDHPEGCSLKTFEGSPHRSHASRSRLGVCLEVKSAG